MHVNTFRQEGLYLFFITIRHQVIGNLFIIAINISEPDLHGLSVLLTLVRSSDNHVRWVAAKNKW